MLRSFLAVAGGYVAMAVLVMLTFVGLGRLYPDVFTEGSQALGSFSGWNMLILGFSAIYAMVAGYLTATVAARSELRHVLALAGLMVVMGIVSTVMSMDRQPLWMSLGYMILGPAAAILGGQLRGRRKAAA